MRTTSRGVQESVVAVGLNWLKLLSRPITMAEPPSFASRRLPDALFLIPLSQHIAELERWHLELRRKSFSYFRSYVEGSVLKKKRDLDVMRWDCFCLLFWEYFRNIVDIIQANLVFAAKYTIL